MHTNKKIISLLATYWHLYRYCQAPCHYLQILKPALTKKLPDIIFPVPTQLVANVKENVHSFLHELKASGLFYLPVIVWL